MSKAKIITVLDISRSLMTQLTEIDNEKENIKEPDNYNQHYNKDSNSNKTTSKIYKCAVECSEKLSVYYFIDYVPLIGMEFEILNDSKLLSRKDFVILNVGKKEEIDKEFLEMLMEKNKNKRLNIE